MKYKISWLIVLFLSSLALLFLSFKTVYQINNYFTLNSSKRANLEKFEIKVDSKDKYEVLAFYNFEIGDKKFYSIRKFKQKFLNELTAQDFIQKHSNKDFFIYYNKKNPNIASVERAFPYKNLVYSIITLTIFIYFIILKYYVFSFQKIR